MVVPEKMAEKDQFLFVYGTLKKDFPRHDKLNGELIRAFSVPGILLYCGVFPAAVLGVKYGSRIYGEVYRVSWPTIKRIDVIEGIDRGLFSRRQIKLEPIDAPTWIYEAGPAVIGEATTYIRDGIWRGPLASLQTAFTDLSYLASTPVSPSTRLSEPDGDGLRYLIDENGVVIQTVEPNRSQKSMIEMGFVWSKDQECWVKPLKVVAGPTHLPIEDKADLKQTTIGLLTGRNVIVKEKEGNIAALPAPHIPFSVGPGAEEATGEVLPTKEVKVS